MGRIVRRYARFFEQEMRGNLKIGEWLPAVVVGIAQYEAGQRLFEVCLQANALGGATRGAYISVQATVAVAAVLAAAHLRMQVPAGVVVTGSTYGLHIEQEAVTAEITTNWEGIRMELFSDAGCTLNQIYGIFMTNFVQTAPANYTFMRMSENGGVTVDSAFLISVGGAGDITNLFDLLGAHTAWAAATIAPGAAVGRIAVMVSGVQLYIPLWN